MKITSGSTSISSFASKAALALGLLVGSGAAYSAPVIWDLGCDTKPACRNMVYASPHGFLDDSVGLFTLNAFGFDPTNTATQLVSKFTGFDPGETGLGLLSDPLGDTEISPNWYIDLVLPVDARLTGIYHLTVSSVQNPERFNVYLNSAGQGAGSKVGLLFANQSNASPGCSAATAICEYDIAGGRQHSDRGSGCGGQRAGQPQDQLQSNNNDT